MKGVLVALYYFKLFRKIGLFGKKLSDYPNYFLDNPYLTLFCIPYPIPYPGVQFGIRYYPSNFYKSYGFLKTDSAIDLVQKLINLSIYIPRD
jgi:hypothetical protein